MGAVLTGLANGLSNVPQQLNDLAYQQQQRQQQLQSGSIQNQMAALQLQQAQQAQQTEQQYLQDMQSAYQGGGQSAPDQLAGAAAPQPAGGVATASAPSNPPNPNLPAPLRNNNPGALMGKDGQLMKFPSIQAGAQALDNNLASYGQKGINTVDAIVNRWAPASAGNDTQSYIKDVAQRLGVDPNQPLNMQDPKVRAALGRAISIHENGRAAVDSTAQGARGTQSQQIVQAADQAVQQPSPADQIAARDAAGVDTPIPVYQQAIQAQGQQISMLQKVYNQAMQQGHPAVAQKVAAQISTLRDQQLALQTKGLAIQKDANEQVASLAAGVHDQNSYNNLHEQIRNNPAMQQAVAGLNLTYDWDQDRNKLQTLADRSVTLKDQSELRIKQAELQLKQQAEQREQAKADALKVAPVQAQAADQKRQAANDSVGIPTTPSLGATMVGATPQQVQAQQAKINTSRNAYVTTQLQPAIQGAQKVDAFTKEILGKLSNKGPGGAVTTGGISSLPVIRGAFNALESSRQEFEKDAANLVLAQQQSLMSLGAARSAGTAAMAKIIGSAKPNLDVNNDTNKEIATQIYVANQMVKTQQEFMGEFLKANPSALPQDGLLEWQRFENSLGDMVYEDDAAQTRQRFNDKIVHYQPDGTVNKNWVDYHDWFKSHPE